MKNYIDEIISRESGCKKVLKPYFEISLCLEDGDEETKRIMLEELERRLNIRGIDCFTLCKDEEDDSRIELYFNRSTYDMNEQLNKSFVEHVLEPARKRASETKRKKGMR